MRPKVDQRAGLLVVLEICLPPNTEAAPPKRAWFYLCVCGRIFFHVARHRHEISTRVLKCREVCPTNKSDVLSLQYVVDTCFRKIFNVKSKDVVHECETELGVFPATDVIDIRKIKFIVK